MKLLLGSLVASFALQASAQNYGNIHQIDPNDIPAVCRTICTPVYYLSQVCNELAPRVQAGYNGLFQGECFCRAGNAAYAISLCAGCVTQQGINDINNNDVLSSARDCAVGQQYYDVNNNGYNSAITVATAGVTTTLSGSGYNGAPNPTQTYYGNGGINTPTFTNNYGTPTYTSNNFGTQYTNNFGGGGIVTPTVTRYGNNGVNPQPYTTTFVQTYNGGQYVTTATVTPRVVNAGTKSQVGMGAILVAAVVCLFTF